MSSALAGAPEAGVDTDLDALGASDLLAAIRSARDTENAAPARQLALAARWADLHPPESIHTAAAFEVRGSEHEEPIAGTGCPLVAEFCVAELGAVLGLSTTVAKKLIGHALELRHRLPRLWALVQAGRVTPWRARLVAETTIHSTPALTPEAAGWVDAQVAAVAGKVGPAQLDRLVAETIKRHDLAATDPVDPAADPDDGYLHVDPRHATLDDDDVHFAGTVHFEADLDLADGLDLDRALAHHAAEQKALGSTESLDVRRARALGDLARTQTALDLLTGRPGTDRASTDAATTTSDCDADLPVAREVVLHAHFHADGAARGRPTPDPARPDQGLVWRFPHEGHHQAGDRPHHRTHRPRLCGPGPDPGGPTSARPDDHQQPGLPVPATPPVENPYQLALPRHRTRVVRVDQPARPPVHPRPHRHQPHRTTPDVRASRASRHGRATRLSRAARCHRAARRPATTPTMTPPPDREATRGAADHVWPLEDSTPHTSRWRGRGRAGSVALNLGGLAREVGSGPCRRPSPAIPCSIG